MKKVIAAGILLFSAGSVLASSPKHPQHHGKPAAPKKTARLVCPVTGEIISSAKAAAGSMVYKGKRYYFCCGDCQPQFKKNPQKYLKKKG